MRRLFGLLLAAVMVAGACSSGAATPASSQGGGGTQPGASKTAVTPGGGGGGAGCGAGTFESYKTQSFCGPGKATVKVADKTYQIDKGECYVSSEKNGTFAGNFGTLVQGAKELPESSPSYLGVVRATGGLGVVATGWFGGKGFVLNDGAMGAKVTIAADNASGSFSGKDFDDRAIEGTFTCK